jgi:formylglycine-generating enzyme required for sulfatase activity
MNAPVREVFISYRRRIFGLVAAMARRLGVQGVKCWFDLLTETGEEWRAKVNEKIDSAGAGIVVFTPDCFGEKSDWVLYEATRLRERGVAICVVAEKTRLEPPFVREQVRDLTQWFRPYHGGAKLAVEAKGWTSGLSGVQWDGVLHSLSQKLEIPGLADVDDFLMRTSDELFGGDLELAIECEFDVGARTTRNPDLSAVIVLVERARRIEADWPAHASLRLIQRVRVDLETIAQSHAGAGDRFWPGTNIRKGLGNSSSRVPGALFRDLAHSPAMRTLEPRKFLLGSPAGEIGRADHEGPQRWVDLEANFAIAETPVRVGEWRAFVEDVGLRDPDWILGWDVATRQWREMKAASWRSPGFPQNDAHPVVGVSWAEAVLYANWLSDMTKRRYRLASEAEWEFAARGGDGRTYAWGDQYEEERAHHGASRPLGGLGTVECARFAPNPFLLFDMGGNVWEWCDDDWLSDYTTMSLAGASRRAVGERRKVARGGGWRSLRHELRCAARRGFVAEERSSHVGLRVVCELG